RRAIAASRHEALVREVELVPRVELPGLLLPRLALLGEPAHRGAGAQRQLLAVLLLLHQALVRPLLRRGTGLRRPHHPIALLSAAACRRNHPVPAALPAA